MDNNHIPYEELVRYIRQESSSEEEALRVEQWINSSSENRQLFESLLGEWQNIYDHPSQMVYPDKAAVWKNITAKINTKHIPFVKNYSEKYLIRVVGIVAMVALLIGGLTTFYIQSAIDDASLAQAITTIETSEGQKMQMTLPDDSKVWLNSGSKLSYAANFNHSDRRVRLEGEAFFDIVPNLDKKFIVQTAEVDIVVKGTAFDVSAYPEEENLKVSLLRGLIGIQDKSGQHLTDLNENELIVLSRKDLRYSLYRENAEIYKAWVNNELVIYNLDIYEVAKKLERWYGINIKLNNPDQKQRYTFSVKTETLRELLELFNKITPIDYRINGKEVTITCK